MARFDLIIDRNSIGINPENLFTFIQNKENNEMIKYLGESGLEIKEVGESPKAPRSCIVFINLKLHLSTHTKLIRHKEIIRGTKHRLAVDFQS